MIESTILATFPHGDPRRTLFLRLHARLEAAQDSIDSLYLRIAEQIAGPESLELGIDQGYLDTTLYETLDQAAESLGRASDFMQNAALYLRRRARAQRYLSNPPPEPDPPIHAALHPTGTAPPRDSR